MSSGENLPCISSPEDFAEMVKAALQSRGEDRTLRYEPVRFALIVENESGEPQQLFGLAAMFDEYNTALESERNAVVDRYCSFFLGVNRNNLPETFEEAKDGLMLIIRHRYLYQVMQMRLALEQGITANSDELPQDQEIPHVVIGDDFAAGLSYDFPDAMIQITGRQLAKWGVSFDQVYQCALENLKKRSEKPLVEAVTGVFISNWQDGYDASRILLTDLIQSLPFQGAPVAMLPSAENLVMTGADDMEGLASVLNVIEPMADKPRSMVGVPLVLRGGEWVPFEIQEGHPLYERFRVLRISATARSYADQRGVVSEWLQSIGEPAVVTPYLATQRKDGSVSSCSVWPEGVPCVIPRADSVVFTGDSKESNQEVVACNTWEKVLEVVGGLLKPTPFHPELYRVSRFPSSTELAQIGMGVSNLK
ncbi:MAG TPA: hypothetical protein EYN91_00890 [Candidatus Melainabacteria bacterium]|jgi:hypothetical protein|nr:hypothetical protein [Candidatus Melainabacteria bacterium]HIN66425.1 hypothetical protein [Candidatus Obscuribacterales bacterium]